ncbi:MAG: XdhC family protein [Halobacteriaceae archaeon]
MSDDSTDTTESAGADSRGDAASNEEIDQLISEYKQQGRRCAKITVVRREPPVSANVGDQAVVTENKELTGWIGGADCAQSIAIEKAVEAIEKGEPLLIGLAPDPDDVDRPGLEAHPMTCHSGGTLELFIEPITTSAHIVVIGDSPVAEALVEIAENMDTQTTSESTK